MNYFPTDFKRLKKTPLLAPTDKVAFICPMRKRSVGWASNHTFNPAAISHQNEVHLFFRAEDGKGDSIGGFTSRIGHAISKDGINFKIEPEPAIFPDEDRWAGLEWEGGCEDPRIVCREDGLFILFYTQWNRGNPHGQPVRARLGVATSRDLYKWEKHGPAFVSETGEELIADWHKSATMLQEVRDGRLVAMRHKGRYLLYWGETCAHLATSDDGIRWTPLLDEKGAAHPILAPRPGHFDSALTEVAAAALMTSAGIRLMINGKNSDNPEVSDKRYPRGMYAPATALYSSDDPTILLQRDDAPFMKPELDFERTGQYTAGTVFAEGLALHQGRWLLYYGTADSFVGGAWAEFRG